MRVRPCTVSGPDGLGAAGWGFWFTWKEDLSYLASSAFRHPSVTKGVLPVSLCLSGKYHRLSISQINNSIELPPYSERLIHLLVKLVYYSTQLVCIYLRVTHSVFIFGILLRLLCTDLAVTSSPAVHCNYTRVFDCLMFLISFCISGMSVTQSLSRTPRLKQMSFAK